MRGLENALARMARRDELRERAGGTPPPPAASAPSAPGATPVVDEVAEALRAVVQRNPGVFATVVVQEADTAWSVWIGEWDGTLRTRVTRLDPDPPASTDATDLDISDQPTRPLPLPGKASPGFPAAAAGFPAAVPGFPAAAGHPTPVAPGFPATVASGSTAAAASAAPAPVPLSALAPTPLPAVPSAPAPLSVVPAPADMVEPDGPAAPVTALPRRRRRPVSAVSRAAAALPAGPTRRPVDASVSDLLRPRPPADSDTPPLGVRPLAAPAADTALPPPGRVDANAPLPKRIPDSGIPLPKRRPALPSSTAPEELRQPALPARPSLEAARPAPSREAALSREAAPPAPTRLPTQPGPARRAAAQAGLAGLAATQAAQAGRSTTRPGPAASTHSPPAGGVRIPAARSGSADTLPAARSGSADTLPAARSGPAGTPPARGTLPTRSGAGPLPPPEVPLTAAASRGLPAAPGPAESPQTAETAWPPLAPSAQYRPAHLADQQQTPAGGVPALPVPTIPAPPLAAAQRVTGPAMNDRVAGRIADMLRREAKRDNRGATS